MLYRKVCTHISGSWKVLVKMGKPDLPPIINWAPACCPTGLYILLPVVAVAALTEGLSSSPITAGTMAYSRSLSSLTHEDIWFPWFPMGAPYQYSGAMCHRYIYPTLEASSLAYNIFAWNCFKEGHIVEYKSQRSHSAPSWTNLRRKHDRRKVDIRSSPDQACKLKPSTYARTFSRYHPSPRMLNRVGSQPHRLLCVS